MKSTTHHCTAKDTLPEPIQPGPFVIQTTRSLWRLTTRKAFFAQEPSVWLVPQLIACLLVIQPQFKWHLKQPLPVLCSLPNWSKERLKTNLSLSLFFTH